MASGKLPGLVTALIAAVVAAGCAPSGPASSGQGPRSEAAATARKRITLALPSEVTVLAEAARQGGPAGSTVVQELLNAGLAVVDAEGALRPVLAQDPPRVENGLWRLFPDGRMETTWKLRPGIKWHDGVAFTAEDLVFTATLERDLEVPRASRTIAYESVESVEAPDPHTLLIKWSSPFIDADKMFTAVFPFTLPLPRHILANPYRTDKLTLPDHPFWREEFVGTGPYRLRELVQASHLLLDANPDFILGRPKIDEVEVRVIPDGNTLVSNILAGRVDMIVSRGAALSVDQAVQIRDQWRDGRVEFGPGTWVPLRPQFLNPSPPIIGNVEFRRALYHAIDRQQMADSLLYGLAKVQHTFLAPDQPQFREVEARAMRYEYDPRRAVQMIERLGYVRGPDGGFRDGSGQRLTVELRTTAANPLQPSVQAAVADYWQQVGVSVDQVLVPAQRVTDREYRATYPGFEVLVGTPDDTEAIGNLHSRKARVPDNNFVGSTNSRYMNPELDALIDRYFVTIPPQERNQVLGQIVAHVSEVLAVMPLFYTPGPLAISNRLLGAGPVKSPGAQPLWNAHEWDVR